MPEKERIHPTKEYVEPDGTRVQVFALKRGEWLACASSTKRVHRGPQNVNRRIYPDGGVTDASDRNPSYK